MAQFPSLPLFTDAFISDTLDLDAEKTGAYIMLLMVAWRSPDCELPDDDDKLSRFARCSKARWKKIRPDVLKFFEKSENGTFFQKRLKKEKEKVIAIVEKNRENGSRGGKAKSLKNNDTDLATATNSPDPNGKRNPSENVAPKPNPIPNTTLSKDNDAGASNSGGEKGSEERPDPPRTLSPQEIENKALFDRGIAYLGQSNIPEAKARSLVGKWRKTNSIAAIRDAIGTAEVSGTGDPVPYIERLLRKRDGGMSDELQKKFNETFAEESP